MDPRNACYEGRQRSIELFWESWFYGILSCLVTNDPYFQKDMQNVFMGEFVTIIYPFLLFYLVIYAMHQCSSRYVRRLGACLTPAEFA